MPDVVVERQGKHVLLCRLNRPQHRNSMGGTMLADFIEAVREARNDDDIRVVVTTAEGPTWCVGADIGDFTSSAGAPITELLSGTELGGAKGLPPLTERAARLDELGISRWAQEVLEFPKPMVAAIGGPAAGGGFGLALLHDFRIVTPQAVFAAGWIRLGVGPEMGASYVLPRIVGYGAALDLLLTGRAVGAEEALTLGLANRIVEPEALFDTALALAEQLAALPPLAVEMTKRSLRRSAENDARRQLAQEWSDNTVLFATDDLREALAAFTEKRPGTYLGR